MVQTVGRCHESLLKNYKKYAFFGGNMTKGITIFFSYSKILIV